MRGTGVRHYPSQPCSIIAAIGAPVLLSLLHVAAAWADDLPTFACAQGNPQLCYAQGQGKCRKANARPDAQAACELWTEGCVECQAAISNCFERSAEPIFEGSAECTACHSELIACMAAVDKEYWPTREQRKDR
jgi:hypothetical protein